MNRGNNNERMDDDVRQYKPDILRAQDIVPPYDKETHPSQNSPEKSENANSLAAIPQTSAREGKKQEQPSKNINPPRQGQAQKRAMASKDVPADAPDAKRQGSKIPKFDLAEEIMAEQRRITGVRRKAPGKKIEAPGKEGEVESRGYTVEQPPQVLSEQEQIIAEIVARDIQELCRRNT